MSYNAERRYKAAHYARTEILLPKESKPELAEYAKAHGFDSFSDFVCYCLEKETGIRCRLLNGLPWVTSGNRGNSPEN